MITQQAQEGNWLYQDQSENYRYFTKEIYLPDDAELWAECMESQKEEWEKQHQPEQETEKE